MSQPLGQPAPNNGQPFIQNVNTTQATPQTNTEQTAKIGNNFNFSNYYQDIINRGMNNLDLVNFAYFLYKYNYVGSAFDKKDPEWLGFKQRINFCNMAMLKTTAPSMNRSRLEQQYSVDIFNDNSYFTFWYKDGQKAMERKCNICKGECSASYEFCPYAYAYSVIECSKSLNIKPEQMFDTILGHQKIFFAGSDVKKLTIQIDPEDIKGINSKSAHAAYILLATRAISIRGIANGKAEYTYLPLCRYDDRDSFINRYITFWKTGSGIYDTVSITDKSDFLHVKRDGCRGCGFDQCPDKLAAYFVYLANKYGCNVLDLAYYIAKNTTYAGITVGQNYQFIKYIDHIKTSSLKEADKAEFIKLIHYIVSRKKNSLIPFLPFNIAVYTNDISPANDLIEDFYNALWYFDYYGCGCDNTYTKSLHMSSTSFTELLNEYTKAPKGTSFTLYDVELLCENREFKAGYHKLLKIMEDKKNSNMTVICGEKESVYKFFADFPEFKKKIFTREFELYDISPETAFEKLEEKLLTTFIIPHDVHDRLERYVNTAYPSSALRSMEFVNDLYEKIVFNHFNYDVNAGNVLASDDLPYIKPPRTEAEIFNELNKLTGLENVKAQLRDVNDLIKFNIKTGKTGKNRVNLHMMFTGSAGTGKTTVARLTAEILHSIGFIQENKLVVCSSKDLIGEYIGHTAPKTAKKCEEAYNGVLFIDEAYQLNPYTSHRVDSFKEECIGELIQQMENNRDRLVVIFAGYSEEMHDFLNRANTGLKSRIGREIEFPDYTSAELLSIFKNIVAGQGMSLGEGAEEKVYQIFENARGDASRFGNARFARSLFERSIMQHASITANLEANDPNLFILQASEITVPSN